MLGLPLPWKIVAGVAVAAIAFGLGWQVRGWKEARADLREARGVIRAQDELAQKRAQTVGAWAIEGFRLGQEMAEAGRTEATRLDTLGDQADDEASAPLREEWDLRDQYRVQCLLDPACDPRGRSPAPAGLPAAVPD